MGIDDHFFELGRQRLTATKVIFKMQQELGIEVKLLELFHHPTVAELAELAEQKDKSSYAHIQALADLTETDSQQDGIAPMTAAELAMLNE